MMTARDGAWWSATLVSLAVAVAAAYLTGMAVLLFSGSSLSSIALRLALGLMPSAVAAGTAATLLLLDGTGRFRDNRRPSAAALALHGAGLAFTGAALAWIDEANGAAATEIVVAWSIVLLVAGVASAWRPKVRWPLTAILWVSPLAILLVFLATLESVLIVTGPGGALAAALCAWHARRARAGWQPTS